MLSTAAEPSHEPTENKPDASVASTAGTDSVLGADPISPWLDPAFLGPKPLESSYGVMRGKQAIECADFQKLRGWVAWDKAEEVKQVWTPASPWLVTPEEVRALFPDVYHREQIHRKHALRSAVLTDLLWALWGVFVIVRNGWVGLIFVVALVGLPVLQRVWAIRKAPSYSPQEALDDAESVRFGFWVGKRRAVLTWCLVAAIGLVWPAQFVSGISHIFVPGYDDWTPVSAVGLVKSAVWEQGEWWRLFTSTVMHAAILHVMLNLAALFVLGMLVEAVAGWHRTAVVFLLSALTGSLFSLFLTPATSIGASGGILGLLGFLIALGYLRRGSLPRGLMKAMRSWLGLVLVVGVIGFLVIDNAAHLGGLLCGALLGAAASRLKRGESGAIVPLPAELPAYASGSLAVLTIGLTLTMTLLQLF
jgi:membrane associated rhomboid family serine protease